MGFTNFSAVFPTPRKSSVGPQVNIILQKSDSESFQISSKKKSVPITVIATPAISVLTDQLVDIELRRDAM